MALRGSPVERCQAAVTKRHPRFPTLGRCLHAQPLQGHLCHYTDVLLQLHGETELTASPSLSSSVRVPQLGLCSWWNLRLEAGMLCPHPAAAPLGCWLRHRFGLKQPPSAEVAAPLSPLPHRDLSGLPKQPRPSGCPLSLWRCPVPRWRGRR